MNPIAFALRRPVTVITAMAALVCVAALAIARMKVDIFPTLNLPVIYVCQPYGGMDASQMEGLITNYFEYHFLYVSGIHHVESRNVQGTALMKLVFHPGTDMSQAMSEVVAAVNRSRAMMPPGTVPPFVTRFDTGSVPVGYLVLDSATRSIGEIQDLAVMRVRPIFASLPGVSTPPPFGGTPRTLLVNVDPDRLRAHQLSPEDVIDALSAGNHPSPSGNVRIQDLMPAVPVNSMVLQADELGAIPIRPGQPVHLRDVAEIVDANDTQAGYALVNGRRSVYMLVTKRAEASTLAVVREVRKALNRMQQSLPEDVRVRFEFDQSPVVTRSMTNLLAEAGLGAILTGLMVLLFLRDVRSVIVVVLNIPLALLAAVIGLWVSGHTFNLMTLGGLALAVGILVDESTVEVENIHAQMGRTDSVARAVRLGNAETAVPRLLALLCILAVFIPAFFLEGSARALFVPMSLAVAFAMIGSYLLSSTLVPVLSVWLLQKAHARQARAAHAPGASGQSRLGGWLGRVSVRLRWLLVPLYLLLAVAAITLLGRKLGTEIFPLADTGQFLIRLRAPTGTRIERTEELALKVLEIVGEAVGPEHVQSSVGYVGMIASQYPVQYVYHWTSGPEEASLRIAIDPAARVRIARLQETLRNELPEKLQQYMTTRLRQDGLAESQIRERVANLRLSFEPADIINEVMSFGSSTAIEVAISGPKMADNLAHARKIHDLLARTPGLCDLQYAQALNYPAVKVQIDRERAGQSGTKVADVTRALVTATSSSRFVVPNYWRDPASGSGYLVQVQVPIARMDRAEEVGLIPLKPNGPSGGDLLIRDVAQISSSQIPGEIDRYNMRRMVSLVANLQPGTHLGSAAERVNAAIREAGEPPRGVQVDLRGQVDTLRNLFGGLAPPPPGGYPSYRERFEQWFSGLTLGLLIAVIAILLLLTGYYQSFRLALVAVATLPGVLAGVVVALWLTNTTINLQSFIGAIMALGVAVANAILLVTFAERARRSTHDARQAAVSGAAARLRPILMTSCAMIAGMVPMALGLGESGEQIAPLGRAVIGGLIASTLTALVIVPALFALAMRSVPNRSASLDPDDPESRYHDLSRVAPETISL